jgi:hypothetical protein
VYMVEYLIVFGSLSPIYTIEYNANAAGFQSLRTIDAFVSGAVGDGGGVYLRDFITITNPNQTFQLRWTANASSGGHFFVRVGEIQLTKLD